MTPIAKVQGPIRILLVDDSAVIRRLVASALNEDPALTVAGFATDGQMALTKVEELRPDIVLLDLEMPVMDGLQTLVELRKTHARLPLIMFSRHTQRGVDATVRALTLGADDYVPKPNDGNDVDPCIRKLLIPKIKALAGRSQDRLTPAKIPSAPRPVPAAPARTSSRPIEIVVIGTSTGGPNALVEVIPWFSMDTSFPFVVVQHMPADFTASLAERLSDKSGLRIREGQAGEPIVAAQGWVAPGDRHLVVRRDVASKVRLLVNQDPPVNACRPSVDVLFRSAAEVYGPGVLAVMLTGMGQDGLAGCQAVRNAGGQVLVQDEGTSVVWGMPGSVVNAGLADEMLPLKLLGPEIMLRVRRSRFNGQ